MNVSPSSVTDRLSPQAEAALVNPDPVFQARLELLVALRWAEVQGLGEGICNHFSVLVPGTSDQFLLNPQGLHWSELTISDLLVVDPEGNRIEGKHEAAKLAIYVRRDSRDLWDPRGVPLPAQDVEDEDEGEDVVMGDAGVDADDDAEMVELVDDAQDDGKSDPDKPLEADQDVEEG